MNLVDAPVETQAAGPTRRPWFNRSERRTEALFGYLFLSPWLVGMVVITLGPIIASLYLAFTDYSAGGESRWVGLDNFVYMFTQDPRYWKSVKVTLTYVLVSVPLVLLFALILAMILERGIRFLPMYRAVYYVPSLLGGSVAIAVLWRRIFGGDGLINDLLALVGIQGPNYIGSPAWAVWTLIVLHVWTFGAPMIIFLAGLRQIPGELYDSAAVDGATGWKKLWYITLPQLSPLILFNGILVLIGSFQAFTGAYIISGGTGGPVDSTLFYTLYLYQRGFSYYNFGYASSMAWVLLIAISSATAVMFALSRRWVYYGED